MRTSSNITAEQRELTAALGHLAEAQTRVELAAQHFHEAGRYGWENDADKLATRVKLLHDRVEAAR